MTTHLPEEIFKPAIQIVKDNRILTDNIYNFKFDKNQFSIIKNESNDNHCVFCSNLVNVTYDKEEIYSNSIKPLIKQFIQGYNVFYYLLSTTEHDAYRYMLKFDQVSKEIDIIPIFTEDVLDQVNEMKKLNPDRKMNLTYKCYQLVDGQIYDILNPLGDRLYIQWSNEKGYFVDGLKIVEINSEDQIKVIFQLTRDNYYMSSTKFGITNTISSFFFEYELYQSYFNTETKLDESIYSKFIFVCLPGLEKLHLFPHPRCVIGYNMNNELSVNPERSQEINYELRITKNDYIKMSDDLIVFPKGYSIYFIDELITEETRKYHRCLFSFLLNIRQLVDIRLTEEKRKEATIPVYDESELTCLLKESLGGNSIVSGLAIIDDSSENCEDSLKVLTLLEKMSHIVTYPSVNVTNYRGIISGLNYRLGKLREKVEILRSGEEIEFRSDNHFKQLLENQLKECKDYFSLCEYQNKRLRREIKRITKTSEVYSPEDSGIRQKLQIDNETLEDFTGFMSDEINRSDFENANYELQLAERNYNSSLIEKNHHNEIYKKKNAIHNLEKKILELEKMKNDLDGEKDKYNHIDKDYNDLLQEYLEIVMHTNKNENLLKETNYKIELLERETTSLKILNDELYKKIKEDEYRLEELIKLPDIEFDFNSGSGEGGGGGMNGGDNEVKIVPRSVYIQSRDRCLKYMEESSALKSEYEVYKEFVEDLVKKQNK